MTARVRVTDRFQITGRGPVVTALFVSEDGVIRPGDHLTDEETGTSVQIVAVEFHNRETPEGTLFGLYIKESQPGAVQAGAVLAKGEP